MQGYEFSEVKGPPGRKKPPGMTWNALAVVAAIFTIIVVVAFVIIYVDPHSFLNPFPPPTTNPLLILASPPIKPGNTLAPSWTPSPTIPQLAEYPTPTSTPLVVPTSAEIPTEQPASASSTAGEYAFALQQGSPAAIDGAQFHPDAGCNWLGVAGQATSLNGEAMRGLFVQLGGSLNGEDKLENITMTGLAPQYGQGGFEITLADKLIASNNTLWIQLLDQQNLPLSDKIYFSTFDDCTKNLVIIYFDQIR